MINEINDQLNVQQDKKDVALNLQLSRLIKVAFYRILLTDFSGKCHRRLNGLEIGKSLPDPILDGLLVPAGWSPGGLKLLFTVFS